MVKTIYDAKLSPSGYSFPHAIATYVASKYKLEQLHMQVLLNCHLAAFLEFEWTIQKAAKWQFNNTCICNCSSLF